MLICRKTHQDISIHLEEEKRVEEESLLLQHFRCWQTKGEIQTRTNGFSMCWSLTTLTHLVVFRLHWHYLHDKQQKSSSVTLRELSLACLHRFLWGKKCHLKSHTCAKTNFQDVPFDSNQLENHLKTGSYWNSEAFIW